MKIENCIVNPHTVVGESPVWDADSKRLFFVDVLGKTLGWVTDDSRVEQVGLPSCVGCCVLDQAGNPYVLLQEGLYRVEADLQLAFVSAPDGFRASHRFNDGKCDPAGRFLVAEMSMDLNEGAGAMTKSSSLYSVNARGKFKELVHQDYIIPNGLAWNRAGDLLYHVDSAVGVVYVYDYDVAQGLVANRRVALEISAEEGVPDGITIDREDNLWIAHWGGAKLSHWNPMAGERLEEIQMPCNLITSCAFGGHDLRTLYITSACQEDESYQAGAIFSIQLPVGGYDTVRFAIEADAAWKERNNHDPKA